MDYIKSSDCILGDCTNAPNNFNIYISWYHTIASSMFIFPMDLTDFLADILIYLPKYSKFISNWTNTISPGKTY